MNASIPATFTANTDATPAGVSGVQRQRYLILNAAQRRVYRYHYDVCGRLAAHCYRMAVEA